MNHSDHVSIIKTDLFQNMVTMIKLIDTVERYYPDTIDEISEVRPLLEPILDQLSLSNDRYFIETELFNTYIKNYDKKLSEHTNLVKAYHLQIIDTINDLNSTINVSTNRVINKLN